MSFQFSLKDFIAFHSRWRVHQESDSKPWACGSSGFVKWWPGRYFQCYDCLLLLRFPGSNSLEMEFVFDLTLCFCSPVIYLFCFFLRMKLAVTRCYLQSTSLCQWSKRELRMAPYSKAPLGPAGTTIWRPQSLYMEVEKMGQRCVSLHSCVN